MGVSFLTVLVAGFGVLFWQLAHDFNAHKYDLSEPLPFTGPLAPNTALQKAKLLLKGKILGPESLLVEGNTIYTGTWDAKILKVVDGQIRKTIYLSDPLAECATFDTEPKCGRPLGIRRLNKDELVVADSYHGVYVVNVEKGTSDLVFSASTKVGGYAPKFLNDIEVLDPENVLVTDSSTKYGRRQFFHVILENAPDGRVIQVNIKTGKARVLMGGIRFANGIQMHPSGDSVIVSELTMARLLRLYIKGPKEGEAEVFVDNLPGLPDNVRLSRQGTFYVGLANPRQPGRFNLLDILGPLPWLRKLLMSAVPEKILARLFGQFHAHYGLVVEISPQGHIVNSYHDPTGQVISDVSQVSDNTDSLFLGSFRAPFIAQVPKKK